jgi:tricorn protease
MPPTLRSWVRLMPAFLLFLSAYSAGVSAETRLLRFPAIQGNQIVFTYAGDLYTVASAGGVARKLTNDVGYESFPRFSPDGKWIAFTGQYDGNTEVYLIPAEGGIPKRLTYTATLGRDDVSDRMGPNNIVMTWKDATHVVYRSRGIEPNDMNGQLFVVSIDGGMSEQLPLPRGGFCSFSADGKQMVYNRVFREFRTWKRYRGGQADDIWLYDFDKKTTTNLTNNPAQDIFPMWAGKKIYFNSDRDDLKKLNLYATDATGAAARRLTNFTEYDVKFPSLGDNAIVFENGGYIYRLDLATEQAVKVPISLQEDFDGGRGGWIDVSKSVSNYEIAPDGNRALFGARGDIFSVPVKYGNTRNLTMTPGIHERNAKWSPDGKWISYVSDATGEDEMYVRPQDGSGTPVQLTKNADTYKYQPLWSPDSKKLLWSDKKLRLQLVDVASKEVTLVVQATAWEINDYTWSPDSKWIAYAKPEERAMTTLQLYSLENKTTTQVTDMWFDSYGPAFSSDGKYLFFISDRSFSPIYSQTEWNHAYVDKAGIYLVTLARETASPFAPKSDEVKAAEKKEEKKDEKKKDEKPPAKIDLEGIQQRVAALPVAGSSYGDLKSVGDKLYYERNGSKDEKRKLFVYELDKLKETDLGEVDGFEISADGKKMLVGMGGGYGIIDLPSGKVELKERLNLSDMKVLLDRRAEWNQIFAECWRQMRDFMFDPNLHHVDWPAIRERYAQLVPYVNHRADLTYIIGEMISELSIGHTYVGGGDYPKAERVQTGLLGAKIVRDPDSKTFRITHILKGQNWNKSVRSPLTDIGVDVREGDYILAVNGKPTTGMNDLYESLVNTVGKQVTLKVNSSPSEEGARTSVVVPIADEHPLYYYEWVQGNVDKVTKATGGKVGYLHIPDMGTGGLNEFVKYYYPQLRKEGLIVDVRGNGGGNVSPMIIERLRREPVMFEKARNAAVDVDPSGTVMGPKVMLTDEFAMSDGDLVTFRFKNAKLGPVIGKRTWGGVVGIRGSLPLLDGGFLNKPEFSRFDLEGKEWIIEGKGVDPDIVVDNDPAREFAGVDDQLNKAIEVIKAEMAKKPVRIPEPPKSPDKSK